MKPQSPQSQTLAPDLSRRDFLTAGVASAAAATLATAAQPAAAASPAPSSKYPVLDSVDVLVAGGGPAGIGAALGAARAGAKTLLIENHSFFGGVAAWALGMPINQVRPGGQPRSAVHELLINKILSFGDQAVFVGKHELWCNVEYLKLAIFDTLDAAGVPYLLQLRAVDTVVEGGRVTGVIVATKRGLMTIRAKAVVDATGDGDVAFFAGAETMSDPKQLMPMTLALGLTNIDAAKVKAADIVAAFKKAKAKYPEIPTGAEIRPIAHSHSWYINHNGTAGLGRIDATDPAERTRAEVFSRRQVYHMVQAIRESGNPALAQVEWVASGPQASVRETRQVKGLYILTEEDAMAGRTFEDAIAWRSGFVDLGGQKNGKYTKMKIHDVPYRAIVPEKLDGLLVAGRCISATHVGAACGKSMGNCLATGHAAGVAAAMSAARGIMPRELKVAEIQAKLRADGVRFDVEDREQREL